MSKEELNFITQTHEGRSDTVICQANMIEDLYPNSLFFIYDGGLNKGSRKRLSEIRNTKIIDWKKQSDFASNVGWIESKLADIESKIKHNIYLDHIFRKAFDYKYSDVIRWDFYMRQKPRTIIDLSTRVDGNIFWMDDDAILINKVDSIFDYEFDFGSTIISKYSEKKYGGSPVNAGVLVFNTDSNTIQAFVSEWMDIINDSKLSTHREQNAIEEMLIKSDDDIFAKYYNSGTLNIGSVDIQTRVFPRRIYNYSHLVNGINPSENKIIHLKGDALKHDVNKSLVEDIMTGNLNNWYRGAKTVNK